MVGVFLWWGSLELDMWLRPGSWFFGRLSGLCKHVIGMSWALEEDRLLCSMGQGLRLPAYCTCDVYRKAIWLRL